MNDNLGLNKEQHLQPIFATSLKQQLELESKAPASPKSKEGAEKSCHEKHPPVLMSLLTESLRAQPEDILEFELSLMDAQPSCIGGALNEFIFSPRIDNLMSSFSALEALVESAEQPSGSDRDRIVQMITLFDNEETGSESAQGAMSAFFEHVLRRIVTACQAPEAGYRSVAFEEIMPRSFILSADMAHCVHPNYAEKHEENHKPQFHGGAVLKYNVNQRYATSAMSAAIIREIAHRSKQPLQEFVVKNDMLCGTTIGPIVATRLGVQTADVGLPQLAMHSCREMADVSGPGQGVALFRGFFEHYPSLVPVAARYA